METRGIRFRIVVSFAVMLAILLPFVPVAVQQVNALSYPPLDFPFRAGVDWKITGGGGNHNGSEHEGYALYGLDFERSDQNMSNEWALAPTSGSISHIDSRCIYISISQVSSDDDLYLQYCHVVWESNIEVGAALQKGQVLGRVALAGEPGFVSIPHIHLAAFIGKRGNPWVSPNTMDPVAFVSENNLALNGGSFYYHGTFNDWGGTCCYRSLQQPVCIASSQSSGFMMMAVTASDICSPNPTSTPGPAPTPVPSDGISLKNVTSITLGKGEYFNPTVTFHVDSGSIPTSYYLHAIPEDSSNTFGAHPVQGFSHNVSAGQDYTFDQTTTTQFRMQAPNQTGTFRSVWQIWNGSRHIGPQAVIIINVRDNSNPPPSGWSADYWTNINLSGGVATHIYEDASYLFRDWGVNAPNGSVGADNWSAQYVRTFNFIGGEYRFHCQHDDGCRLFIDGQEKIGAWWDSSFTGHDWTGTLSAGNHEVKVHYYDKTGDGRLEAWWQGYGFLPYDQTCVPTSWCGEYYGNRNLMGTSAMRLIEDDNLFLDRGWGFGSPFPGFPENNFSARFTRTVPFGCGVYRFHVIADDGVRFYIDGAIKLNEWHDESADYFDVDVAMTEGNHQLMVDYFDNQGDTGMRLSWVQLTSCATPTPVPTNTPTATATPSQPPSTVTLAAVEDTYAESATPDAVLGSDPYINIDSDPPEVGYLKFNLSSLAGTTVTSAKLRFYVANASNDTQQIKTTSTTWSESSLTWNNKPALGSGVGTISTGGTAGVWKEVDLTAASVQASVGGTYAIGIDQSGTDGLGFPSSENSNAPALVINYTGGASPTSTPVPPTPTNTPIPPTPTNTPVPPTPTSTPAAPTMVELLSAPWNLQAPHSDSIAQQFNTANMLLGKTTMRITYNLHGLMALDGGDSCISFTQDNEEKRISLADYGTNGLDGWQTIDVPISDFGIDTSQPLDDGEMWTHWWYSGPYHVEITSIKVYTQ